MWEIWKDIQGYEWLYLINNCGFVFSKKYNKFKNQRKDNHGYMYTNLYKNSTYKIKRIHRLVAESFIPNPENKPQVNHIDWDKSNNKLSNLERVTNKENWLHAIQNIWRKQYITWWQHWLSKKLWLFSDRDILLKEFSCATDAAKYLGIAKSSISQICLWTRNPKWIILKYI